MATYSKTQVPGLDRIMEGTETIGFREYKKGKVYLYMQVQDYDGEVGVTAEEHQKLDGLLETRKAAKAPAGHN